MYVTIEKKTNLLIHISELKVRSSLRPKEIYFLFDEKTMEQISVKETLKELVDQKAIKLAPDKELTEDGKGIRAKSVDQLIKNGLVQLGADEKLVDGKIVKLTLDEQIEKGILTIDDHQKIRDGEVIQKTIEEKIEEGIIVLEAKQEILNGAIVEKSTAQLLEEKLITLDSNQKFEDGTIKEKTVEDQIREGHIILLEPLEYFEGGQIKRRTFEEILKGGLIKTKEQAELVTGKLKKEIAREIKKAISVDKEIAITKAFIEWTQGGKPKKDEREKDYLEMQIIIEKIKNKYAELKENLKTESDKFEST